MSESLEELFDRHTKGRLPEKLDPTFEILIRSHKAHLEYGINQLQTRNPQYIKKMYINLVDEQQLNAMAFIFDKLEFVGINVGFAYTLPFLFMSIMAHPKTFEDVGDPSLDTHVSVPFDDNLIYCHGRASSLVLGENLNPVFLNPKDKTRQHYVMHMCIRAWDFILFHEIGHLIRCHLPFLRELGFLSDGPSKALTLFEFQKWSKQEQKDIIRAVEVDADCMAARAQIDGQLLQTTTQLAEITLGNEASRVVQWGWDDVLVNWLRPIALLFQIMAILDRSPKFGAGNTHPHPDTRLFLLSNLTRDSWRKVIPNDDDYKEIVNRVIRENRQVWTNLMFPRSVVQYLPTYKEDLKGDAEMVSSNLNEIAPRLNELTKQRTRNS